MNPYAFFLTTATLGLGFCALVSVLGLISDRSKKLEYQDVSGIRLMTEQCFALIFFSLLTVALSFPWRYTSGVIRVLSLLLAATLIFLVIVEAHRWGRDRTSDKTKPRHPWLLLLLYFLPQTVIGLSLFCFSLKIRGSLVLYSCALVWLLVPAGMQFWTFVQRELRQDAAPAPANVQATKASGTPK